MNQVYIGHVDADCFYVSAERVRYPHLIGVPCGVMGNQGACVIAKSYELKACGVKTGEAIWDAAEKCPDGVFVKRDFRWYETLSLMMLDVVREYSPEVEQYSIDESFFLASPPKGGDYQGYTEAIRDTISKRVGVPATVGIARTKTLAKLISDSAKPYGALAILDVASERALLASLPVTEISGIGGRRAKRLLPWGIQTCLDLADADRKLVRQLLTASGEALWWELNGEPAMPIHTIRPLHKSLSRGGSFGGGTRDPAVIWGWLVRNVERLIEELEYYGLLAGRVEVWLGYKDGKHGVGAAIPQTPTDRFDALLETLAPCLRRASIPDAIANRMHLFARDLRRRSDCQIGLFEAKDSREEVLAAVKREINKKIGRFALRSAATLPLAAIYRDSSNEYDICDIRGKMCF